jgi:hypothetical protein
MRHRYQQNSQKTHAMEIIARKPSTRPTIESFALHQVAVVGLCQDACPETPAEALGVAIVDVEERV